MLICPLPHLVLISLTSLLLYTLTYVLQGGKIDLEFLPFIFLAFGSLAVEEMERRVGWQEEDEHHKNPFLSSSCNKASSSKLQFRKNVSRAQWDEEMGMGEIVEKKGSIWTTTGIIRNGKLYCHIEEILFLAERGALYFIHSDDKAISIGDLYEKIVGGKYECNWESFEAYKRLKSLGYIIGRHGVPWTVKEKKSLIFNSLQTKSSTEEMLDLDVENGISILFKGMQVNELQPIFDVYLPNSKFKKSSPGVPVFLLCVLKANPPLRQELRSVERRSGGIPIKFCFVDHGQVSFFSFDKAYDWLQSSEDAIVELSVEGVHGTID